MKYFIKFVVTLCLFFGMEHADASINNISKCFAQHRVGHKKSKRLHKECLCKIHKKDCCESFCISQKDLDKARGTLLLSCSGDYCLSENIIGTLIIGADSICLNLCCHTLDAGGRPNAIVADGHHSLKVYNGRIINSTNAAILVNNYTAVELFDLEMNYHALDAIRQTNSIDLNVNDVAFLNSNSGERALLFSSCSNIAVKNCSASGFLSTIGAIIQLDNCRAASVEDVDVTNNGKISSADTNEFSVGTALVSVSSSSGVNFVRVKVNNNIFNNNIPISDPNNHWRTAEAIFFLSCSSCSLHRCETSNNTDVAGSLATEDTEDFFLCLLDCNSCIITEHQSNQNTCTQPIAYFMAIASLDSTGMVVDGCQANNNLVSQLLVSKFITQMFGYDIGAYFSFAKSNDNLVRNCQANFNRVEVGGAGRANFGATGVIIGIGVGGTGAVVDYCQANHNTMGDSEPHTSVIGIFSDACNNATISNSSADNNTGGQDATGILLYFQREATRGVNPLVLNCSANSNGNNGISIGYFDDLAQTNADITIIDCLCNKNGGGEGVAKGIVFQPVTGGTRNALIKGCQIYDTFSTFNAVGIFVENATNLAIQDCQIYNTTSSLSSAGGILALNGTSVVVENTNVFNTNPGPQTAGFGILFDSLNDSKIIRSQVHGNRDPSVTGVALFGRNNNIALIESIAIDNGIGFFFPPFVSTSSCSLVQDCRAINNISSGFDYAIATPLTITFIGNEAQCNGETADDNYLGLAGLISLQELKLSNGSLTSINPPGAGAAALGARFTNLRVVP